MTLKEARKSRKWTIEYVAAQVSVHGTTVARVERGELLPGRMLARDLFCLFGGDVPLSSIYDPTFKVAEIEALKRKNRNGVRQAP